MLAVEKCDEIRLAAKALYSEAPDWVIFYRGILGRSGIVRQLCSTGEQLAEFKETDTYAEIQRMLIRLRNRGPLAPHHEEPTEIITVRLPRCVHQALKAEAYQHRTSVNKLCISKLLQIIDNSLVPADLQEE